MAGNMALRTLLFRTALATIGLIAALPCTHKAEKHKEHKR